MTYQALKREARERDLSMSEVLRQLLRRDLMPQPTRKARRARDLGFVALGRTSQRPGDRLYPISEHHDEALSEGIERPNPRAGVSEVEWVQDHPEALRSFRGNWVAILGRKVLTSRATAGEVYDFLRSEGLADALVMKVPPDATPRHRIFHVFNANR
jgi:hypothetical protein